MGGLSALVVVLMTACSGSDSGTLTYHSKPKPPLASIQGLRSSGPAQASTAVNTVLVRIAIPLSLTMISDGSQSFPTVMTNDPRGYRWADSYSPASHTRTRVFWLSY